MTDARDGYSYAQASAELKETLTHYAAIREKEQTVVMLEAECEEQAEQHRDAKKALDRAIAELRTMIRQGPEKPDPQGRLPFESEDPPRPRAAADPHAWQSLPVAQLDLPDTLVAKLEAAGIETIGALESQRAGPEGLRGIPKVGQATADKIEAALLDLLSMTRDAKALKDAR